MSKTMVCMTKEDYEVYSRLIKEIDKILARMIVTEVDDIEQ